MPAIGDAQREKEQQLNMWLVIMTKYVWSARNKGRKEERKKEKKMNHTKREIYEVNKERKSFKRPLEGLTGNAESIIFPPAMGPFPTTTPSR